MEEQLRTEAEKVLQENYTESIKGIESISTPHFPKAYNECAIKSMLDFHAQQSKDNTEAIDRLKSIIEACPKGILKRELSKVLKDLQIK